MSGLTFKQNLDREGEWVATLDGHFNGVGCCKDSAVRNLYLWMKKHHAERLQDRQHIFDAYRKPKTKKNVGMSPNLMTIEDVKNSQWRGEPIGEMDRNELLQLIGSLFVAMAVGDRELIHAQAAIAGKRQ